MSPIDGRTCDARKQQLHMWSSALSSSMAVRSSHYHVADQEWAKLPTYNLALGLELPIYSSTPHQEEHDVVTGRKFDQRSWWTGAWFPCIKTADDE